MLLVIDQLIDQLALLGIRPGGSFVVAKLQDQLGGQQLEERPLAPLQTLNTFVAITVFNYA